MFERSSAVKLQGELSIPGSKSHTIRALLIAALAGEEGESLLLSPLVSQDTLSARAMIEQFGATVREDGGAWRVRGIPSRMLAGQSSEPIEVNVGNSGTALFLGSAVAALFRCPVRFDGDASIRTRSAENLLRSLQDLGAEVRCESDYFCCPYTVCGPLRGGSTHLFAPTSQYLSALLLALPLSPAGSVSEIVLDLLNEHPYVDMTLEWLDSQQIERQSEGYERYRIKGGQSYRPFQRRIPADFSSATFFLCAAALSGSSIRLLCLDPNDSQGDKQVPDFLRCMGCDYNWLPAAKPLSGAQEAGGPVLEFHGPQQLRAAELDLSQTPDALPALAVVCACVENGRSRIFNVAHARHKETDRIACMATELQELGFAVTENPDGLSFEGGSERFLCSPRTRQARGYHDHRIVMALSLLNLLGPAEPLVLDDSSSASVTFPGFFDDLQALQG